MMFRRVQDGSARLLGAVDVVEGAVSRFDQPEGVNGFVLKCGLGSEFFITSRVINSERYNK